MGAVSDAIRAAAEGFGAEIRVDTPGREGARAGRPRGRRGAAGGEEFRAPVVITACHPQITFLRQIDRGELPEDVRARHRALAVALGHREDQPRARRAARLHGGPRVRPRRPGRRDQHHGRPRVPGDGVPGGARGPSGHPAVRRLRDPHGVRPHAGARGQARDVDVHAVGAGAGARSRTARSSRPTPTA